MGPFVPPPGEEQAPLSDECSCLKIDVTKKCLFCLNKGVFETWLLR